ncbi:MAG: hypothetical protein DRI37_00810 [Chloroflexi bacterium]|nr:MAG: hypothetical protein DRI37_00810 [Chloroflexota bacterium]
MLKRTLPTAVAISTGILVLLGSFLPVSPLREVRLFLIQWAMVLGIFAFILAFLHLLRVHLIRLGRRSKGWSTSLLLVLSAISVLLLVSTQGPTSQWSQHLMNDFLVPGESALLALTAVTLVLAGMRMLRARRTSGSILFLLIAVLMLVGTVPYVGILGEIADWIQGVPALAGMRGLLLGVALGTTMAGLRVVFGATRPHSDD